MWSFDKLPSKWSFNLVFPAVLETVLYAVGWSPSNAELNGSLVLGSIDLSNFLWRTGDTRNLLEGITASQFLLVPLIPVCIYLVLFVLWLCHYFCEKDDVNKCGHLPHITLACYCPDCLWYLLTSASHDRFVNGDVDVSRVCI